MTFSVITKDNEYSFTNKELINISSKDGYDVRVNLNFDFVLTVNYDVKTNTCTVLNQFNCEQILFKGKPLPQKLVVEKTVRLMAKNSDEFIQIKLDDNQDRPIKHTEQELTESDVQDIYGNKINAAVRIKLDYRKSELEEARVSIIKQVYYSLNELTRKLSMNSKTGILLHIILFFASVILAFGVSNYFSGLELKDAGNVIQMPVNFRLLLVFGAIIYGVSLVLKQGVFLYLQNKTANASITNKIGEKIMIISSALFYAGIYIINLLYYVSPGIMPFFAVFMGLFLTLICVTIAFACGYYKHNNVELSKELNKYEYREDFEKVIREYQQWIEWYINSLSNSKITSLKDSIFNLKLKSAGEIMLGVITAPFLAYGVSNTLAMCFPEAAGWIRISGVKFSPIFLILASFMIIFAFFIFVHAFTCSKKIQASNVLKNDGFSNYLKHGVEIYGLQGIKRLDTDKRRSFFIGLCVVFIEFTMNISYFMQEMGEDFFGTVLSFLGALVPTALLIAETYMLSQINFQIETCNEILEKIER